MQVIASLQTDISQEEKDIVINTIKRFSGEK
jgi:hypothetical protein